MPVHLKNSDHMIRLRNYSDKENKKLENKQFLFGKLKNDLVKSLKTFYVDI